MNSQPGEVNTDPKFLYQDNLDVLAYRMGIVETDLKSMDIKLDRVINEYPTHHMLSLVLQPLRDKVDELEKERRADQEHKVKASQSYKTAVFSAIASPIFSIIIVIALVNTLGLKA